MFFSFPFIINARLAYYIFRYQIKNAKWFNKNSKLAVIITLLGSGNVKLLHLLDSNFAGFSIFSIRFSQEALDWIFLGGFIDILIQDFPQLLILVTKIFLNIFLKNFFF